MIQLVRQKPMATRVSRQKINLTATHLAPNEHIRRGPKWSVYLMLSRIAQLFHLIQAAAANDPDRWNFVFHSRRD
jgi:hypothetical protein